jgi:hypothetical protein
MFLSLSMRLKFATSVFIASSKRLRTALAQRSQLRFEHGLHFFLLRCWREVAAGDRSVSVLSIDAGAEPSDHGNRSRGGVFPAGAAFNGVSLSSLSFGMGVALPGDGTANGAFETTLAGTSTTGIARSIVGRRRSH